MTKQKTMPTPFSFFGSSRFSVIVLEQLFRKGLIPSYIITTVDKPIGRKQIITANVVKQWANEKNIPVYDPAKLNQEFVDQLIKLNKNTDGSEKCPVFLVASYGKIIPKVIIDLPSRKTLNIHPSLLPKYRGPSPLPSAMLDDDKKTGVTIMRIDEEMDHGPIVAKKEVVVTEWPIYEKYEAMMADEGAKLFAEILPKWIAGEIKEQEQDHSIATYTKKITKEDGLIDLSGDAYTNFRKIQAYHEWPKAYFFMKHTARSTGSGQDKEIRVKITEASFSDGQLKIQKVIPEGAKEMAYEDFLRGYKN
ncbi:MAG: methionyl-tRNA formyltransferase [Candidatus Paceibacterota bacterium]